MTLTGDIIPGSMVLVKAFSEKTAGIAKKVPPVDTGGTCIQNGTDLAYCSAVNGQFTGGAGRYQFMLAQDAAVRRTKLNHQLLFGVMRNECNRHPLPSPLPKRLERFCKKVLRLK